MEWAKIECHWCGAEFDDPPKKGAPRKYCRRSCRQRAYEARNGVRRGRVGRVDEQVGRWSK